MTSEAENLTEASVFILIIAFFLKSSLCSSNHSANGLTCKKKPAFRVEISFLLNFFIVETFCKSFNSAEKRQKIGFLHRWNYFSCQKTKQITHTVPKRLTEKIANKFFVSLLQPQTTKNFPTDQSRQETFFAGILLFRKRHFLNTNSLPNDTFVLFVH